MPTDIQTVFLLLLGTVALFASDRLRMDVVALLLILGLMLTGILAPDQALAGFGDPLVIMIAGLFLVGEGLFRTGVALAVGNWLMGIAGSSETRLLILLMLVVAVLSAFMSNTGAVAIFIPVAINLARQAGLPASRLLLPMAYAGSMGGMLTLIGTPPNMVVSTELGREGLEPFNFFSFLPIGILVLGSSITFIVLWGRRLLPGEDADSPAVPDRLTAADLVTAYGIQERFHLFKLAPSCELVGQTVEQARLRSRFGATVIALERDTAMVPVLIHTEYLSGDILFLVGAEHEVQQFTQAVPGLRRVPMEQKDGEMAARDIGMAEVLLPPRSGVIGRSIRELRFREDHGLSVLGILRRAEPLREDLLDTRLEFGDALLVAGGWPQVQHLHRSSDDFLPLVLPKATDEDAPNRERAPWALGIVAAMLLLMTFSVVPVVTAVLLAAVAMVLSRCVTMEESYNAINWQSLVLIAGMLPMATALEQTGALSLIVNGLVSTLGDYGPYAIMAGLFVFTSVFSQFISNTATAVLVAPIAFGAAVGLDVSPYPLLMTVALAASTAFSTPMASPVNTLVTGPGGYRFGDFAKLGIPLQLLAMAVSLLFVPLVFPL